MNVQGLRLFMSRWKPPCTVGWPLVGVCCGKDLQKPQRRNQKPGPGALALQPLVCVLFWTLMHCTLQMLLAGSCVHIRALSWWRELQC